MTFPVQHARLVVFDLDGTLIDSIGDIGSSVNQALSERYGAAAVLPLDSIRGFVGGGARQLIERCLQALGRPVEDVDAVFDRFLPVYTGRRVETTRLYPGIDEALTEIEKQARLAILTNKPGDLSRAIVRDLKLGWRFIEVVGGGDLKTKKPDPEGLLAIAARAGVSVAETVLVGDSAIDILTAHNAGARSIGVLWGYDRAGVEKERPGATVATTEDLARLFRGVPVPETVGK